MKLIYDEESSIPTNLKQGDELFLFDGEVGALHVCTFQSYGTDKNQEPTGNGRRRWRREDLYSRRYRRYSVSNRLSVQVIAGRGA